MQTAVRCAVFALTACMLFGTSAVYHRGKWSARTAGLLRRLDHSNIALDHRGHVHGPRGRRAAFLSGHRHAVHRLGNRAGDSSAPCHLVVCPTVALHGDVRRSGLGGDLLAP